MPGTQPLTVSTVEGNGLTCVVAEGELDLATADLLEAALVAVEATDTPAIVLDIEAVSFIDSTGLRVLLKAHARSQQNGGRLRFTPGSAQAKRLFALVAIENRLPFVGPSPLDGAAGDGLTRD